MAERQQRRGAVPVRLVLTRRALSFTVTIRPAGTGFTAKH